MEPIGEARRRCRRRQAQQRRQREIVEPFISGFIADNDYIGRPVDVQPMRDGSVLVSDDWNGAVYRITWGSARVVHAR